MRPEAWQRNSEMVPVAFWDVAACFAEEDWKVLHEGQKIFYRNVMKEIHQALIMLGYQILHPETLLRVINTEDAGREDPENAKKGADLNDTTSSHEAAASLTPDMLLRIKCEPQRVGRDQHSSEANPSVHNLAAGTVKSERILLSEGVGNSVSCWQNFKQGESMDACGLGNESINEETLMKVPKWEEHADPENPKITPDLDAPTLSHLAASDITFRIKDEDERSPIGAPDSEGRVDVHTDLADATIIKSENLPVNPGRFDIQRKGINPTEVSQVQPALLLSTLSEKNPTSGMCAVQKENPEELCNVTQPKNRQARTNECKYCNEVFIQQAQLATHMQVHRKPKSFVFDHLPSADCGEETYKCAESKRNFSQSYAPRGQKKIHTGKRPYECSECKKRFSSSSFLRRHLWIHARDKPYHCPLCGDAFHDESEMRQHQRSHLRDRPYKCTGCENSYSQRSDLDKHQRIHTGENRYQCPLCGNTFNDVSKIKQHLRAHLRERPHQCADCGNCYSEQSDLYKHQRIHAGKKPFTSTEGNTHIH